MNAIAQICEFYGGQRIADLDIVLVPKLLDKFKGSSNLLFELVQKYPIRGEKDDIVPGTVQWVGGANAALKYRGNELKREKIWLQRNSVVENGYAYYYYTGVQWEVVPAQTDWAQCPEMQNIVNGYDDFCEKVNAQKANQAIITRYRDGDHFIGAHFDKPKSIAPSNDKAASLITVIKIGEVGRRFNLYDLEQNIIWSEIIAPGDALIMTLEANLKTKHEVPICQSDEISGDSGSIVFRSICDIVSYSDVQKKIDASRRVKQRTKELKRKREISN